MDKTRASSFPLAPDTGRGQARRNGVARVRGLSMLREPVFGCFNTESPLTPTLSP